MRSNKASIVLVLKSSGSFIFPIGSCYIVPHCGIIGI